MSDDDAELALQKSLASFMTACTPIEQYLMDGKPLTQIELDLIATTTRGLQTALEVWNKKNGTPVDRSENLEGQS